MLITLGTFELLPDMLVSIQKYANYHVPVDAPRQAHDDVKPLSVVYEILQRWDKSLAAFESQAPREKIGTG